MNQPGGWGSISAIMSRPVSEAQTRPIIGSSSHGAMARVAPPRHTTAASNIGGPISNERKASTSHGRLSTERQSTSGKHTMNHNTSAPDTRARDQRHNRPSAGITGQSCMKASVSSRFALKTFSAITTCSWIAALDKEISADSATSSMASR